MWELDYKERWVLKNWCFWTLVLEKTLESHLDCKEIQPVNPKGNQSWIFIGRTDAEVPILWPPDAKKWLTGKDPDAGRDWRQEEKGMTEDEMVGWHHQLNEHDFEQALGAGDGQGSLGCCSPWGHKELDTTEWTNWTDIVEMGGGVKKRQVKTQEEMRPLSENRKFFIWNGALLLPLLHMEKASYSPHSNWRFVLKSNWKIIWGGI